MIPLAVSRHIYRKLLGDKKVPTSDDCGNLTTPVPVKGLYRELKETHKELREARERLQELSCCPDCGAEVKPPDDDPYFDYLLGEERRLKATAEQYQHEICLLLRLIDRELMGEAYSLLSGAKGTEKQMVALPAFHPHSFRHMLARYGFEVCQTPADLKAWSQNLGHEQMLTTFTSYGRIDPHRQGEIIKALGAAPEQDKLKEIIAKILAAQRSGL